MRESTKKKILFWLVGILCAVSIGNGIFALKANIDEKKANDKPAVEQTEDANA